MNRKIIDFDDKHSLLKWAILGTAGLFVACCLMSALGKSKPANRVKKQNQEICDSNRVYQMAADIVRIKE